MKVNVPITDEDHAAADVAHKLLAKRQKAFLSKVANKLDSGADLNIWERAWAADAVRYAAGSISGDRRTGHKRKLPGEVIVYFVIMLKRGMTQTAAIQTIVKAFGVDTKAVKRQLGLFGAGPERAALKAELDGWKKLAGIKLPDIKGRKKKS